MSSNPQRSASLDIITFGESMGLLFPEGVRGIGQGGSMAQSFGGAESNVAIGLARLGCRAGWCGQVGDDPLGAGILKALRGEGVDVSHGKQTNIAPTGLMLREAVRGKVSVYYYRAGSAASRMTPADLDASYIADAKILHLTGITPALSGSCLDTVREAIAIAKNSGVKICFDPNLRLKLWTLEQARPVLLELAASADYFLPGFDELKLLYQTDDKEEILRHLGELPGTVIVKSAFDENWIVKGGVVETALPFEKAPQVVDTVGAGDGFCAGFLSGLAKGMTLPEAVRIAGIVGSLVVQAQGDWEALPTLREVEAVLHRQVHIER
ncbi:sugar kinase [Gorillibacterium massiliense]|uniref:sugar kinase n=1 Tax=Gorillibacterium massiliense TaxID=1280390 RepID=UPI0004B9BBED|nr:sugar kinase [Gorillibacterium massiliense]